MGAIKKQNAVLLVAKENVECACPVSLLKNASLGRLPLSHQYM
jgi:hypothetical protein